MYPVYRIFPRLNIFNVTFPLANPKIKNPIKRIIKIARNLLIDFIFLLHFFIRVNSCHFVSIRGQLVAEPVEARLLSLSKRYHPLVGFKLGILPSAVGSVRFFAKSIFVTANLSQRQP